MEGAAGCYHPPPIAGSARNLVPCNLGARGSRVESLNVGAIGLRSLTLTTQLCCVDINGLGCGTDLTVQ